MSEEKKKESVDQQMLTAARSGDLDLVKQLHKKGANINCAIMGGSDGERTPTKKQIMEYAFDNGACMLFGFSQPKTETRELERGTNSFFSRVSMLKGPGDVSRNRDKVLE
jgi:hypothetical protein